MEKKKTDYGESVRIRTDLVDRARQVSKREGPTIKFVIERILDKNLPPVPKTGDNASTQPRHKGGKGPR